MRQKRLVASILLLLLMSQKDSGWIADNTMHAQQITGENSLPHETDHPQKDHTILALVLHCPECCWRTNFVDLLAVSKTIPKSISLFKHRAYIKISVWSFKAPTSGLAALYVGLHSIKIG